METEKNRLILALIGAAVIIFFIFFGGGSSSEVTGDGNTVDQSKDTNVDVIQSQEAEQVVES